MTSCGSFIKPNQSSIPLSRKAPLPIHGGRKQVSRLGTTFVYDLVMLCVRSLGNSYGEEERTIIRKDIDGWKINYSRQKPATPLLDTINYPAYIKNLSTQDLEQLAAELRADIVHNVSNTGGHLSSSLGVVE